MAAHRTGTGRRLATLVAALAVCVSGWPAAMGGAQERETLSPRTRTALRTAISDLRPPRSYFEDREAEGRWVAAMSERLRRVMPGRVHLRGDPRLVPEFLRTLHYEAKRQGLDPQMVLAVIHVESAFNKYAVSSASARGYMQVMPFWVGLIGTGEENLFDMRVNLRFGTVILRHYLDIEDGEYFGALGRYNGSLGKSAYVDRVLDKMGYWEWPPGR